MSWIVKVLLPLVLPFILGQLTTWLMAALKLVFTWIGQQNATVQQILVGALGVGLAALAKLVGAPLPCDPTGAGCDVTGWGSTVWTGLLSALVAFVLHNSAKVAANPPPA